MPFICCVPGCFENGKRNLHSFPKNQDQCEKWIAATRTYFMDTETAWKTYFKVCRRHFRETDLRNGNLLKKNVVPSQVLPHSLTLEHDYCVRNSIAVNAIEAESVANESLEDCRLFQNQNCTMEVNESSELNGNVLLMELTETQFDEAESNNREVKIIMGSFGANIASLGCDSKVYPSQEISMEVESSNEMDNSDILVTVLEKRFNGGECISEDSGTPILFSSVAAQETSKNKPTRTYDPVARKMRYLLNRNKVLSAKLKQIQSANFKSNKKSAVKRKIDSTLKTLSMELPAAQYNFIKLQLKNAGRAKKGNRFSFDDKTLALVIYKQNPKRYNNLRTISNLPTRQTLIAHSAAIRFKEGLNYNLMNFVRQSQMELLEKICTVGWDEMSLTSSLQFDQIKDYIDGFEDHGTKRTNNFATHALVFMVRGVKSAYKQPISYFLTESLIATELAELVRLVTSAIMDTGLKVIGSVCDAAYTNSAAVNILIGPKRARENTLGKLLEYTINGTKICHIFDPPHLIKSIRNNLLDKNLSHTIAFNKTKFRSNGSVVWNEKNKQKRVASWKDVSDFYIFNNNCGSGILNLIPKITSEHMLPTRGKMKVNLATQVFSGTYGRNMYMSSKRKQFPNNCIGTAGLLLFFNDLFDSVNGIDVPIAGKLAGAIHTDSTHYSFWDYAMRMLDAMNFSANLKTGRPNKSNVCRHWISTLKGLKEISERLFKMGFESIGLRRMNQDGLENHFFKIRNNCGSNARPNARDFRSAYTTAIVASQLSDHSLKANCEADSDKYILQNIQTLFTQEERTDSRATVFDSISESNGHQSVNDPNNFDGSNKSNDGKALTSFAEDEALNCLAGDVCKQILEKMKCDSCSATVTLIVTKTKRKCHEHDIMSKQSANDIVLPKVCFINCIKKIAANVQKTLPSLCAEKDLTRKLLSGLTLENDASIGCDLHRYTFESEMKNITAKFVINRYVVQINRILSGTVSVAADIIQKKALDFRTKKKHIGKYVAPAKGA